MGGLRSDFGNRIADTGFYPRSAVTTRKALPGWFRFRPQLMVITREDIEGMMERLRGCGWRTGTALGVLSGAQKRKLKAICSAAAGAILNLKGSPGFKLTAESTRSEIRRGIAIWRGEARESLRRALAYRRHLRARECPARNLEFSFSQTTTTKNRQ